MRILLLPLAFLACVSASSAMAERPEARCTAAAAIPATIGTIQKDFKDWSGHCVRLRGLLYAGHLFTDRMATLALMGRFAAAGDESIALYPEEAASGPAQPAMIEVIGKLGSCAEQEAAARALEKQQPN